MSSLNLAIIDICNLRCKHCDIWMNHRAHILDDADVRHVLSSRYIDTNTDITITGGEPFLHPNISSIIRTILQLGFRINTISTNGTHKGQLIACIGEFHKDGHALPNIHISIDGNERSHDLQRGKPGSFQQSIRTILTIRKLFPDITIKLKCTLTPLNTQDIPFLANLARDLGAQIGFKPVEVDSGYTNRLIRPPLLPKEAAQKIQIMLRRLCGGSDPYIDHLSYFLEHGRTDFRCSTPSSSLFVMADGRMYSCTKHTSIGNFRDAPIDSLLFAGAHVRQITTLSDEDCRTCFSYHGSVKSIPGTI